jgi:hypothetical protein
MISESFIWLTLSDTLMISVCSRGTSTIVGAAAGATVVGCAGAAAAGVAGADGV